MKKTILLFLSMLILGFLKASLVVFTPNNSYFDDSNPYLYLDVNNDGFNDFLLSANPYTGPSPSWFKIKALTAGTKVLTDGTGKVNALNDSVIISTQTPSNLWADSGLVYQSVGGPFPYPVGVYTNIAFRFSDGANNHFGYINGYCEWVSPPTEGFNWYQISRVAYETTPNGPVKAAANSSIVGTPEPSKMEFSLAQLRDCVHLTFAQNRDAVVDLLDIQGRVLASVSLKGMECEIPTASISSGVYLLQVTSRRNGSVQRASRKFVLNGNG